MISWLCIDTEELNDSEKDEEGCPLSSQSLDIVHSDGLCAHEGLVYSVLAALGAKPGHAGNQPCFGAQATTAACSVVQ